MRISLLVLFLTVIRGATDNQTREGVGQNRLIVGINANELLARNVMGYGVTHGTRSAESGKLVPIAAADSVTEHISIARDNLWRRGGRFLLVRNESQVGMVQIGVFADPNEALRIYRDHLFHTSVLPQETLDDGLGNRSVRWWTESLKGFTRILFVRDNAVIDIYIFLERFTQMGGSASSAMGMAKAIDFALVNGTSGVTRGKALKVPRIVAVETPTKIVARSKVETKVRIAVPENPQDKNSKEIEITRTLSFYAPSVSAEDQSQQGGKVTYEVTYISPDCVVTSREVTVTVTPTAPSS